MNRLHLGLLAMATVLAGGCLMESLRPFYDPRQAIVCPQVEGRWALTRDSGREVPAIAVAPLWTFVGSTNPPGRYSVFAVEPDSAVTSKLALVFFTVGERTYCDVTVDPKRGENRYGNALTERVHTLGRVDFTNDLLRFTMLNRRWMQTARTNGTLELAAMVMGNKALLITDDDFNWQQFLEKHGNKQDVFATDRMFEFRRK